MSISLPEEVGRYVFVATAAICLVGIVAGPRLRGITSRGTVLLPGSAALAFLISLAMRSAPNADSIPFIRLADAGSLLGYVLLAVWMRQLSRKYAPRDKYETRLDSLMVATGVSLIFWSLAVAPSLAHRSWSLDTVMLALYPAVDVVLATLTAQLIYRIGAAVPAMAWFLMAVIVLLIIDTSYTVVWLAYPGLFVPALSAGYLFAYAGFALGLSHPSLTMLDQGACIGPHRPVHRRRGIALVFILLPSVTCVVYPAHGLFDTVVRALLIIVAIGLMYAKLDSALRVAEHAEERSTQQARCDPLTGLGNRARLSEQLPEALRRAAADERTLGVLLLDLDGFKRINDTWGHSVGDEALKAVATRLEANTPWALFTARLGGDEFLVCAQGTHAASVVRRAEDLRALFDEPICLTRGPTLNVTPSIGITTVEPTQDHTAEQVLREADIALYEAKREGKSRSVVYEGAVRAADEFKRHLTHDLEAAIRNHELATAFQPIVSAIAPYPIRGWEALARWRHPEYGVISPEVFIAVAEEHGLLDDLLHRVIQDACDLVLARNASRSGAGAREWVSVNVTPAQILAPGFMNRMLTQLQAAAVPPSWFRLEVTETALMPGDELANNRLRDLREAGIGIFLDDFGAGFAGIGILRQLQFDAVKIDRSFVGPGWSASDVAALQGVINLARGLNVRSLIAEGVETLDDARAIEELGIELAQGWFYGAPAVAAEVTADVGAVLH
ncbi:MAG: bifunctional diguanylate cyclase/phosphodiesterase [Micrococcales bacterium]|nr:bifunctional diguanylate cyclase/phosphodiesterase [Micrococcales bacterium]